MNEDIDTIIAEMMRYGHEKAADCIRLLLARLRTAERRIEGLEILRPVWAQGYTTDSEAAQATGSALAGLWAALGAKDQTDAMARLNALTASGETCKAERDAAREVIENAVGAIQAAREETHAEHTGLATAARHYARIVEAWHNEARAALNPKEETK